MPTDSLDLFQEYFDKNISSLKRLDHNGNNKLFSITLKDNTKYLIKEYSKIHLENWNRGYSEFKALNYLWKTGFRNIPRPIKFNGSKNIGVYSFEKGFNLNHFEIKEENILGAVSFLVKLHNLKVNKQDFGPASSACLNLKNYIDVIDRRFNNIKEYNEDSPIGKKAKIFLDKEVHLKIVEVKEFFFNKTLGVDIFKELNLEEQVLTPGDFGFHNILYDGKEYKFLDFEYFGRDDPVRQILDFMHHDKSSNISDNLKNLFLKKYKSQRNTSEFFDFRISVANPLIAMTWGLIYLNILSPKYMEHLKFSNNNSMNIFKDRLNKAEAKIRGIKLK
ncbi:MAG: hypothetical protein AABW67_02790 [Nanoarchaeota archaeon]